MTYISYTTLNTVRCCLMATLLSCVANAATIDVSKYIEIGATVTDNLDLVDQDVLKEDDLVYNVKPSVKLEFNGNRFGVAALGQVDVYKYQDFDEEVIDPRLFVRARGTLIDGFMFLDSQLTLAKLVAGNAFIRPSDDGNTAVRVNTKAYIERSFGRVADLNTSYTVSTLAEVDNDNTTVSQHTVDFSLGRNPNFGGVIWGIGASYTQDKSNVNEFQDSYLYGKLGGTIAPNLLAEFTYGKESRELINNVNTQDEAVIEYEDTPLWKAQLNWSPNESTTLTVGFEDRFFGSGPNMELNHRVGNSIILASYTRNIGRQAAALNGVEILGQIAEEAIVNTQNVNVDNVNNTAPLDQPYVDNTFKLAYKLRGRLSDFLIDATY